MKRKTAKPSSAGDAGFPLSWLAERAWPRAPDSNRWAKTENNG